MDGQSELEFDPGFRVAQLGLEAHFFFTRVCVSFLGSTPG